MKTQRTNLPFAILFFALQSFASAKEFQLECESWWRADTTVVPGKGKKMHLKIKIPAGQLFRDIALPRDEVKVTHKDFILKMSNDRGSVILDIIDAQTKKLIQRFLWQFAKKPTNLFHKNFTGHTYYCHPKTGSELQMVCRVK